jgi:hypothetical protein
MRRFTAEDFGYDFSKEEETESLVGASASKNDEGEKASASKDVVDDGKQSVPSTETPVEGSHYKLYEEQQHKAEENEEEDGKYRYQPEKIYRGGESYVVADDPSGGVAINGIQCLGAVCCCLTACLVICGGIIISFEEYRGSKLALIGSILIVLSIGACLCGCCSLCIGATTEGFDIGSSSSESQSRGDPNYREVKVRLRRLNDRYEKGCMKVEQSLKQVRLDVVGHLKEVCI